MKKKLIIIKLGGSVITQKTSNTAIFKKEVVKRLINEIKASGILKKSSLLIVHGAGSFGHPLARKYRLNEGFMKEISPKGISLTKRSVVRLNSRMVDSLFESELMPVSVETSSVAITTDGKINTFNLPILKSLLDKNLIPVLSGDVVTDLKKGISILSGDQIVMYLAKHLNADLTIFISDVDGIFDKNPKIDKKAKLIPTINKSNYKTLLKSPNLLNENDVTGEMWGKINSILDAKLGKPVFIINGLKRRILKEALLNRVNGTRVDF